ncbi:MAG TPA: zinc-binding dehydrogenase [Acidimicrobiia bacterium]|nr:zinc-binding dehydrogenase [Acidimicrobiia bacterium]
MRAWRVHEFGEPADVFVREEVDEPTPSVLAGMGMSLGGWVPIDEAPYPVTPEWVIVDMHAAALALPDVTMARGTYPVPVPRPYISGQEGVGTVRDASTGLTHLVGTRVVGVFIQPWGSLADVAVAIAPSVMPAPDSLDDTDAAAFIIPAHTAFHAVIRRGRVADGETVLVTGAAGGLGSACVQLAAARGARVIALVGDERKAQHCRALGAELTVVHATGDVVELIRGLVGDRGLDAIVDPVQGPMAGRLRQLLAPDGRHILCGHAGGLEPIDPHFYVANVTLVGATLGGYPPPVMAAMFAEASAALSTMLDAGTFRPPTTQIIGFDEVPETLTAMAARRTIGRPVVRLT